jgi:hypothetical protein
VFKNACEKRRARLAKPVEETMVTKRNAKEQKECGS